VPFMVGVEESVPNLLIVEITISQEMKARDSHITAGIVTKHHELCSLQRIRPPRFGPASVVAYHHPEDRIAFTDCAPICGSRALLNSIRYQTGSPESFETQVSRREVPFLELVDCFRVFEGLDRTRQMYLAVLADYLVFARGVVDAGVVALSLRGAFGISEDNVDSQAFCFGEKGRDVGRLGYVFAVFEEGI